MQGRKIKHLYTIQRPFALGITRAYRTTSSDALNVLAGLLPLHIRVEEEAARQIILQLKKPTVFDEEYFHPEEYEVIDRPLHVHPASKGTGVKVTINPSTTNSPTLFNIFTDGSKMDEKAGCSYIVMRHDTIQARWKAQLRQHNSVFQGEAIAIAQAVNYLLSSNIHNATIKTDNLSSLHAIIMNPNHVSKIIQGIQANLRQCNLHIKLEWIKAHAGHLGNEMADQLAKEAALGPTDLQFNIPWPVTFLKKSLRLKAIGKWQQEWDDSTTGRRVHYHISYVDTERNIANSQLVRYISGHGPFPVYFYRFGICSSDQCTCGHTGSPEHYLTSCPLTEGQHVPIPTTNRQSFCKFLIKQRHLIQKIGRMMDKLADLNTDLCQI
ncbi:uncharacterized protein LOC118187760 [Stegodyphus dumicola]|uniref:uncharacterized protein LOC118187760 n=1 Tax=Stegodyphus dumicola TaxID=202533 RepID=UPI0015A961BE|nr:uncharacterized protein LOC118187760 [Stegodyphus dumicola]